MTEPTISIAMPFHNSRATLAVAVHSVLEQSFESFELLLCDDGSTDGSLDIARSFDDPRVVVWSDGKRRRLAARLNECIDRARGRYLARMDADDISYPDRLTLQLKYLEQAPKIDLCGGGALVFGFEGLPLWRFDPATDHGGIIRAPFKGFPVWHPTWMGRTAWFRRWRYDETALLAQDQELLLRSFRESRFANLPHIVLGYRQERVLLKKLFRYKVLWTKYVCLSERGVPKGLELLKLILVQGAKFGANCVAALGGPTRIRGRQGAKPLSMEELTNWQTIWQRLSTATAAESEPPSQIAAHCTQQYEAAGD